MKSKSFILSVFTLMLTLLLVTPVYAAKKNISVTMYVGQTRQYVSDDENVIWTSNKPKIATVSADGVIKARRVGKCTITAKVADQTYKCFLTVKKKGSSIVSMNKLARYSYFRKYMSEAEMKKAYKIARKMLLPLEGLDKKQQLQGITRALREYFDKGMSYSMKTAHYNDPYGYLVLKSASCAGCTRTAGMMLNMLGINYEHINENQYTHQWARVKIGKKYWICDAYGLYCGPEPAARKHPYLR